MGNREGANDGVCVGSVEVGILVGDQIGACVKRIQSGSSHLGDPMRKISSDVDASLE